jgi:hypothetical protein
MEALKAHHKERESYVMFRYDNHSTTFISQLMRPGVLSFSAYQLILEVLVCDENRPNIFLGDTRTEPKLLLLVHQQN